MALDMQIVGCHENMHINFHCLVRFFFIEIFIFLPCRPKRRYIYKQFICEYVRQRR